MRDEIAVRPIAWVGASIAAVVALVVVAVFLLLRLWNADPGADRVRMRETVLVPGPVVQSAPQEDLRAYREEKRRILESAAWVDAQRGIARIPIADAMAILAASAPRAEATR
ncbi:hypothetical protein H8N03_13970 [Ramlibacter sp. USB13]|uniref:Uncharacterized protein n=1 Tax=Ramlibacter cellulosilyticus TaxID=2764187 RepID=A0A923MTU0_9BURK|nr:hypothetical protein [Ramlibacter cellulosilyticus]MBC5784054.1 hypothetical protein [Ramlibacter cellulosilyticus]